MAFLFECYQQLTAPLVTAEKKARRSHQSYSHEFNFVEIWSDEEFVQQAAAQIL